MTTSTLVSLQPFKNADYHLNNCQLRGLTENETKLLGQTLAQIEPWYTLGYQAETMSSYFSRAEPSLYKYGIFVEQQLAGVICVRYPWLKGGYLEQFALFPAYQKQGIGRTVLDWLATELQNVPIGNLWALVSAFNHNARHFYRNYGFIEIAPLDNLVKPGFAEILLRKVLITQQ